MDAKFWLTTVYSEPFVFTFDPLSLPSVYYRVRVATLFLGKDFEVVVPNL